MDLIRNKKNGCLYFIFLLGLLATRPESLYAQAEDSLNIYIHPFAPFVTAEDREYKGFDIDLWEAIAKEIDMPYKYVPVNKFEEIFSRVKSDSLGIGLAAITMTQNREEEFNFSYPYFNSGLNVALQSRYKESFSMLLSALFDSQLLNIILGMLVFILISSHLIWFFERGEDAISDTYFPGIFEGAWWTIVTMSTVGYGDISPKKWTGRMVAVFVIIMGITFFGIAIAELSATFASQKMGIGIQSISDLKGRKVGVLKGTTAEEFMSQKSALVIHYPSIEKALEELEAEKIDAVVGDDPVLRHLIKSRHFNLELLGKFKTENYGILFSENNNLRENINRELLKLEASGQLELLRKNWFDSN